MVDKKIAICTVIKDEHQYLQEWIEYHKNLGIEYFYIYEDEGSSSHSDICNKFNNVQLSKVTDFVELNGRGSKQKQLFNKFIETYQSILDYVFFIDVDEFVTFSSSYDMESLIDICDKYGSVLLAWKMYGADGHIDNPNTPVVETFTRPIPIRDFNPRFHCKSFVKLGGGNAFYNVMKTHHCHISAVPVFSGKNDMYTKCWLNHYITKSWEEWCNRLFRRGLIVPNLRKVDDFFMYNGDMYHMRDELKKKPYFKVQ